MIPRDLLGDAFSCECGRRHRIPIERIDVGEHALEAMPRWMTERGVHSVVLIDDAVTGSVLGDTVRRRLHDAGLKTRDLRFPATDHLRADAASLAQADQVIQEWRPDIVLAVGSGTLTDIARYSSFVAGLPFAVMATAPSVDGYASTVAALQLDGVKVTKPAQAPQAIFAMPSVLAAAPWPLIQSGFGDLVGKTTALMDWKLATRLYGEDWCGAAYRLVSDALHRVVNAASLLKARDPQAVRDLFEALIGSGFAMAMVGNSRPASGSEHHLSHYWDYLTYVGRRPYVSHGLQVGYATQFMMRVYETLEGVERIEPPVLPDLGPAWEADVRGRWGAGAADIVREQQSKLEWLANHGDPSRWQGMDGRALAAALEPEFGRIEATRQALAIMGIPNAVGEFSVTSAMLAESLTFANEVRARYTILDWLKGQGRHQGAVRQVLAG